MRARSRLAVDCYESVRAKVAALPVIMSIIGPQETHNLPRIQRAPCQPKPKQNKTKTKTKKEDAPFVFSPRFFPSFFWGVFFGFGGVVDLRLFLILLQPPDIIKRAFEATVLKR